MEKGQGKGTDTLQTDNVFTRKEYIEREAAIAALIATPKLYGYQDEGRKLTDIYDAVRTLPAADVVPVRHGRWIEDGYYDEPFVCSYCGEPCKETVIDKPRWHYCPNCGARMDGDSDGV